MSARVRRAFVSGPALPALAALALAALVLPAGARAQGGPERVPLSAAPEAVRARADSAARELREPSLTAPLRSATPVARFAVTGSDQTVAAQLGVYGFTRGSNDLALDLTLGGPVGEVRGAPGGRELADLDGLRTSTTASLALTVARWSPTFDEDAASAVCEEQRRRLAPAAAARFRCAVDAITDPGLRRRYRESYSLGTPRFLNLRATVGQDRFAFADGPAGPVRAVLRTPVQGTLSAGARWRGAGLVTLSYRYERAYEGQDARQICSPIAGTASLACAERTVGAPSEALGSVASLEWRRYAGRELGVAPTARYDLRERVFAAELPLYYLRDRAAGLASGLRLGYRSDTRRVTLVAFVAEAGAPFTR